MFDIFDIPLCYKSKAMRKITAKLTEVVRLHPSGIRVRFDNNEFNYTDVITADKRYGTQYYISNKQNGIYDLIPQCGSDTIPDNSLLKVGRTFEVIKKTVGEYDSVVDGPF